MFLDEGASFWDVLIVPWGYFGDIPRLPPSTCLASFPTTLNPQPYLAGVVDFRNSS